jgi:NADPH:quinone reductase-like Zn-dependent oxidoreductase
MQALLLSLTKLRGVPSNCTKAVFVKKGKMKSVIDRRYPLEQTAEAHRDVEQGHKQGSVVITLEQGSKT